MPPDYPVLVERRLLDLDRPVVHRERWRIDFESPDSLGDRWLLDVKRPDFSGKSPDSDSCQPLIDLETSPIEDEILRFEVEQRPLGPEIG